MTDSSFNNCDQPVCKEDITIEITNINCTADKYVHIEWVVNDIYNRSLDSNSLLWSCDSELFNNTSNPSNSSNPYNLHLDASSCDGIIYFKIKIRIGTSFFESDVHPYDTAHCGSESEGEVYRAYLSTCDISQDSPEYELYILKNTTLSLPSYFEYDNICWEVTSDTIYGRYDVDGIIIENISDVTIYDRSSDCC